MFAGKHGKLVVGIFAMLVLVVCTFVFSLSEILMPVASGKKVLKADKLTVDASNADQGYIMVKGPKTKTRMKVTVEITGTKLQYDINGEGEYEVFPLQLGRTNYTVSLWRQVEGKKYGKIVNVTSVRGKIATKGPGNVAYCASKGALDMLTKQLASEFGPYGITVNGFGPNIMKTPMMNKIFEMRANEAGVTVEKYLEMQAAGLPLRRMSDPEDCVGTALFLAAPASDFLTGNILYPDGGLTAIG